MRPHRVTANLHVPDVEAASFYTEYLGLSTQEFSLGWVARYTAPEDSVISVHVDDVDGAHEEARRLGYEIVHPLTTEEWGVRRFLVRAPDGNVVNVVQHRD